MIIWVVVNRSAFGAGFSRHGGLTSPGFNSISSGEIKILGFWRFGVLKERHGWFS